MAKKKKLEGTADEIYQAALKAFWIDEDNVLADSFDEATQAVTLVTNGGRKVRYQPGDNVSPLDQISITGINPIKRKPIAGKEKK